MVGNYICYTLFLTKEWSLYKEKAGCCGFFFPVFNDMNKNWEKEDVGEDTNIGKKKKKAKNHLSLSSKEKHFSL